MTLSLEEQRIANAVRRWAEAYERRYNERGPWSFDRIRAKALIKVAEAIEAGKHRL